MVFKKERRLKVCYKSETRHGGDRYGDSRYIEVPFINLKGKWLGDLGFDVSTPIKVECEEGRLVITKYNVIN
jgi:hypothetical protein|nr:MAG TPA: Toxin SymE, type I toxin-antitoxin system [Caudoviricetes sp.]